MKQATMTADEIKKVSQRSHLETTLGHMMILAKFPPFEAEYKFCPERQWRFDFANLEYKVAVEVEGGVWHHGRHQRPMGFIGDAEKYNMASSLGWLVIRLTQIDIEGGWKTKTRQKNKVKYKERVYCHISALDTIKKALKAKGWVE